jgi:glycosyltransferase involved in cell wall biosynthesis
MQLSIVIPLFNEEESLVELHAWIKRVMTEHNFSYEIVLVDDGSKDKSWQVIEKLASENKEIQAIKFQRNYGKSAGLNVGFEHASGDVIITMDADLQDNPEEIPELYRMITQDDFDLVSGWKKKRYDPVTKTIPTKLYNATTRFLSGIKLHDMNCGLKAYKREVVKSIEVYGDMHRYIPVLAKKAGFDKIGEKVVQHQARKFGVTKFGLERFIYGPLDLLSVMFMTKFSKRPMHVFGTMGGAMFLLGFFLTAWVIGQKALYLLHVIVNKPPLVTENLLFYIALTSMVMGTQLFLAGFLGELISRSSSDRNKYLIEKKIV